MSACTWWRPECACAALQRAAAAARSPDAPHRAWLAGHDHGEALLEGRRAPGAALGRGDARVLGPVAAVAQPDAVVAHPCTVPPTGTRGGGCGGGVGRVSDCQPPAIALNPPAQREAVQPPTVKGASPCVGAHATPTRVCTYPGEASGHVRAAAPVHQALTMGTPSGSLGNLPRYEHGRLTASVQSLPPKPARRGCCRRVPWRALRPGAPHDCCC